MTKVKTLKKHSKAIINFYQISEAVIMMIRNYQHLECSKITKTFE